MTQTCCPHSPGRKAGGGRAAIWVEPRTFGGRNDSSDPGAWDPVRPGRGERGGWGTQSPHTGGQSHRLTVPLRMHWSPLRLLVGAQRTLWEAPLLGLAVP